MKLFFKSLMVGLIIIWIWGLALLGSLLALPQCSIGQGFLGCRPSCDQVSTLDQRPWMQYVSRCQLPWLQMVESLVWQKVELARVAWVVSFLIWIFLLSVAGNLDTASKKKKPWYAMATQPFKWFFYPLFLIVQSLNSRDQWWEKGLTFLASLGFLLPVWFLHIGGVISLVMVIVVKLAIFLGLLAQPIPILGTGSMFPTFPKGSGQTPQEQAQEVVAYPLMKKYPTGFAWQDKEYFRYTLGRGDIVNFANQTTAQIATQSGSQATGFVKRVVGLPGDTVEIKNGFVWLNGSMLNEPYTATPRSTFGGQKIADCAPLTIPENKLLVLGDNRKASNDSRHEVGLINISDVTHVLPWTEQNQFHQLWRTINQDQALASQPVLVAEEYLQLLNQKRVAAKLKPLKLNEKLNLSAQIRAEVMLKTTDLSYEATRSGVTMKKALERVGYSNIVLGEAPTLGYYSAGELLDYYMQFPTWKDFLLSSDFQETGISSLIGEYRGCPTQIVVQHFAGYKPPNYAPELVSSWQQAVASLKTIQPGWEELKQKEEFYQQNKELVDRITSIIQIRIEKMEEIATALRTNQWLTPAQEKYIEEDKELSRQQFEYAQQLNSR